MSIDNESKQTSGPADNNPRPPRSRFMLDSTWFPNPWIRIPLQIGMLVLVVVAWVAVWQFFGSIGLAPGSRPLSGWFQNLEATTKR